MPTDHLDELETKISRLLENHLKVKKEKEMVEKRLSQKEGEFHHLRGQIRRYEKERGEFREKLEKLLVYLENLDLS